VFSLFKELLEGDLKNYKLADTLKDMTCVFIGCSRDDLEDVVYKNKPLPETYWKFDSKGNVLRKTTPRDIMIILGTDFGRDKINNNIWIGATLNKINRSINSIVTDVRFKNEADSIRKAGGIIVRVNRPEHKRFEGKIKPEKEHYSETDLDEYDFDYVLDNSSTKEFLKNQIIKILVNERINQESRTFS
jgi:hypothetical protein